MPRRTLALLTVLALVAAAALGLRWLDRGTALADDSKPLVRGIPPETVVERDGGPRLEPWLVLDASLVGLEPVPNTPALVAVDQRGQLLWIASESRAVTPWLDLRAAVATGGNEQGLLGVAFDTHPALGLRVYASYTDTEGRSVLRRWRVPEGAAALDPADGETLLTVEQPYRNHNGGHVTFGPDGMLYWGLGDGGAGGDPQDHAERTETLLGTLLRLDVSGESGYAVPPDNPFVGVEGARDEIFAYGLRNPWRFLFDAEARLWIADVGQNRFEEVNMLPHRDAFGAYFGCNTFEAHDCFRPADCDGGRSRAVDAPAVMPIYAYGHDEGCSVSGGLVIDGAYVFTDFCTGDLWRLRSDEDGWVRETVLETELMIPAFAEDAGTVYVLDIRGTIYTLDLNP